MNLRYMYLMDSETPTYHCFGDFINEELAEGIEDIFKAVMEYIREKDHVEKRCRVDTAGSLEYIVDSRKPHAIGRDGPWTLRKSRG